MKKKDIFGLMGRPNFIDLSNFTCVVTGGRSGIGAETCHLFAGLGATVVAIDYRYTQEVAKAGRHVYIGVDVRSIDKHKDLLDTIFRQLSSPRLLVNAAGIDGPPWSFWEIEDSMASDIIETNLTGVFRVTKAIMPFMAKGSTIVNIAAYGGYNPYPKYALYSASKSGVIALSRAMRQELANRGIKVSLIIPGPTATPMQFEAEPWPILLSPKSVAKAILFVALLKDSVSIEEIMLKAVPPGEVPVGSGPISREWVP